MGEYSPRPPADLRRVVGSGIELEAGDAGEVAAVAGDENQAVVDGGGGNLQIKILNASPCGTKLAAKSKKPANDRPIQREHVDAGKQTLECLFGGHRIAAVLDAEVDLAVSDDADCDAVYE